MKQHLLIIIISLAIIGAACARHSTESPDKTLTDSEKVIFDTLIEEHLYTSYEAFFVLEYFKSKQKLNTKGYLMSLHINEKPTDYKYDKLQAIDTLNEKSYMDIYALEGKETQCLAYINNITPPAIVISTKNGDFFTPDELDKIINNFFHAYGLKKRDSIFNPFAVMDYFIFEDKILNLADKSTRHNLDKMFGGFKCISYDLPSDKGTYEKADSTLLELRQQIARQEYIDSVAKLAHYSKPSKHAEIVDNLLKADPETVVFVSDYLTDKKR